ncbi:hypothetical protein [Clostridium sardiniense]|uniref:hypothetical protein n=1 Tax=Clostridium sardiniense TaxID=29369 RepID=UPI00195A2EBE|nr:hypothetical protein [Clostridium sardiniense]MBM7833221.1 hypothetical protein [Clostridium sardiniense]
MYSSFLDLNESSLIDINGGIGDLSYDFGTWIGKIFHGSHDEMVKSASHIMGNHTTIRR